MSLTPIPQKKSILEQSLYFLRTPRKLHYRSTEKRPEYVDSGDVSIPIMLALLSLFQYLAPLRAMRITLNEDLLLFFLQAPTIGFCLKILFTVELYHFKRTKDLSEERQRKAGDEQRFREKTIGCLKLIAERCTYLTQLTLLQVDFETTRSLIITDLLPKLHRLELFSPGNWEPSNVHPSQFVEFGHEHRIANLLPTAFASNRNLVSLMIHLTGDVGEFKTLLSQVTKSLRILAVHGKPATPAYIITPPNSPPSSGAYIDSTVMEIIVSCAPKLTKLDLTNVTIANGFFLLFSGFSFLRELTLNCSKVTSDDPLEFQYLQEACGTTLQKLVFYNLESEKISGVHDPLLALTGRLVRSPGTNSVALSEGDLTNVLSFPVLTEFRNTYSKEVRFEDWSRTFFYLAMPCLTKLDFTCHVYSPPPISFSALMEFISQHRNLQRFAFPSSSFRDTGGLSMINHGFNLIGENLLDLREFSLNVDFSLDCPEWSTETGSKEITFSSWKNLTKLEKLIGNFVNDNLLKIAGEHWRENFVSMNIGNYLLKENVGYISDEGLDAFSKITSPPPSFFEKQKKNVEEYPSVEEFKSARWSSPFRTCHMQYLNFVTDQGLASFFRKLSSSSESKDMIDYRGLRGVSVAQTPVGILTCEALSLYPSIEDADFQGTKVDESCFNAIAKCTALTVLFFDNPNIRNVEAFSILAKSLPDLCYFDLYGLPELTEEDADRLHEIFAEQIKYSSLYIGTHHT